MKIFLDSSDTKEITELFETGLIDGVTTNPSLMAKSGRDPVEVIKEISNVFPWNASISAEVIGDQWEMLEMAEQYVNIGPNITIKVPCTPEGLMVCKELSNNDIPVNVTLVFSQTQAILAAKAGAKYVSPFVGRVDDNSFGGLCLVKDIATVYREHMVVKTEVLAASLRGVRDVGRAFEYGADIVTMPPSVFEGMYKHILTDAGLKQFDEDYAASITPPSAPEIEVDPLKLQ